MRLVLLVAHEHMPLAGFPNLDALILIMAPATLIASAFTSSAVAHSSPVVSGKNALLTTGKKNLGMEAQSLVDHLP